MNYINKDPRQALAEELITIGASSQKATLFSVDAGSSQWMSWDEIVSNEAIEEYLGDAVNPLKVREAFFKYIDDPRKDSFIDPTEISLFNDFLYEENKKAKRNGWK